MNHLYLSEEAKTTLYETRVIKHDVVTVGEFKIVGLSQDMSHPMRRFDSAVEYVPTQFICEYVQLTQSVSGIRFASSVYPEGTNVVIFEPALMHCVDVKDYNIGDLDINETAV